MSSSKASGTEEDGGGETHVCYWIGDEYTGIRRVELRSREEARRDIKTFGASVMKSE